MIRLKDSETDQVVEVPTWDDFKSWIRRVVIAYALLGVGFTVGVWALTNHAHDSLRDNINNFARVSCLHQGDPGSTVSKYNDLIDDLLESRRKALLLDIKAGDKAKIRDDNAAIIRYQNDKITIPSVEQCAVPILKE